MSDAIGRVRELVAAAGGQRRVLGIAGEPGAGKSTLAAAVVAAVPDSVLVPMDGFHLPTAALAARGWVAERGTPRTFDAAAYVALLARVRTATDEVVWAPAFDRSREEPVPGAIAVGPSVRLVVTEGNYLLLWPEVRPLLDECWYVEVPESVRVERLVTRHVQFGRTFSEAQDRVIYGSDAANAELVRGTRDLADVIVRG